MEREHIVFLRGPEDQPTIIHIIKRDMDKMPTQLATIEIPFEQEANGLPSMADYNRLANTAERIIMAVDADAFVGHTISRQVKRLFFYHNGSIGNEVTVKTGLLKKATFPIQHREDAGHAFFNENLKPTPLEFEKFQAEELHEQLAAHGDDSSKPRTVDFTINFKSPVDRDAFLEKALAMGYERGAEMTADTPNLCHLTRMTSVEPDVVGKCSAELRELAGQHYGDFDGWGCPVQ